MTANSKLDPTPDWPATIPNLISPQVQPIINNHTTNIHITNFNPLSDPSSSPSSETTDSLPALAPSARHQHLLQRELISAFYTSLGNPDGTTRYLVFRWLRSEVGMEILSNIFGLSGCINAAGIKGGIDTVLKVLDPRYKDGLLRRGNMAAHVFSLEEAMGVIGDGGSSATPASGQSSRPATKGSKEMAINDTDAEALPVLRAILNLLKSKSLNPAKEDLKTAAFQLRAELLGLYPKLQEVMDIEKTAGRGTLVNDILYRMRAYGEEEKIGIAGEVKSRVEKDPTDIGKMDWSGDEGEGEQARVIPPPKTQEDTDRMGSPPKKNWDAPKNTEYQKQPGLSKLDLPWRSKRNISFY
ncbi:hypothetical protein BZA77DRAFT_343342 [Pyronema omphalodes]|nr:hypothetical protein BZA77DRAFT_367331 [Pyronema omphalodes]KAI5817672.1 hypothetical protein BZA77DRAFT_343342 [Pyronema omphalodes]